MNEWHDAEDHVERAHQHYEAGRWDDAESELRKALASNPYQVEWHFNLGLTLDAAGRFEAAAEAFRHAQALEPDDPQISMMVGVAILRSGRAEEALGWLDKADALAAEVGDDHAGPADDHAETRDARPRATDPRSSEAGPPPSVGLSIAVHRIEALASLGRHEEAETAFYVAQELNTRFAPLYAAMSDSLMARGLFEKAIWCLREAGRLDPDLPRIHARLAEAYASTGRLERARTLYVQELRRDPGDIDCLLDLADLLVRMGRLTEAGEKYRRVLEIEPDEPDAHYGLGDLLSRQGDLDAAVGAFNIVLRLDPKHRGIRRRIAEALIARAHERDLAEARRLLRHELRDLRKHADAPTGQEPEAGVLEELGRLFLDVSLPAEASGVLRSLLEAQPDNPVATHLLSVARFRMGDREGGMHQARRAIELDPQNVRAMHNLAMGYLQQGQWTRARFWVERARAMDADDASLRRLSVRLRLWAFGDVFHWLTRRLPWGPLRR